MNFRQVGKKIKTIGNVRKITKAMQMVSAVKMRKSQKVALEGKPYREVLEKIMMRVTKGIDHPLIQDDEELEHEKLKKNLYIVVTSNKGLAGSYNFNLLKYLFRNVNFESAEFITVGKKGAQFISRIGAKIVADFSEKIPFSSNVSALFQYSFENYFITYVNVYVVYNRFISTFKMEPAIERILPIPKETIEMLQEDKHTNGEYLIEPAPREMIDTIIKDFIKEKITKAIFDAEAAEHSARMMAMKNATDNAGEIIFSLNLIKNKLRQSSITNELLDMTTAKESTEES